MFGLRGPRSIPVLDSSQMWSLHFPFKLGLWILVERIILDLRENLKFECLQFDPISTCGMFCVVSCMWIGGCVNGYSKSRRPDFLGKVGA